MTPTKQEKMNEYTEIDDSKALELQTEAIIQGHSELDVLDTVDENEYE